MTTATTTLPGGVVHEMPADLEKVLLADPEAKDAWLDITPLARNEWICLVVTAKQEETRLRRIERTRSQLTTGQRRPCCWAGCVHRTKGSAV